MKPTPFHGRLESLNATHLWEPWSGYLSAVQYQQSATFEYFAVRNSAAIFDTSPLFKYRIVGPDAGVFLSGLLVRDPDGCALGSGQYTAWCDDQGFVLEDGVILRTGDEEFWMTTANPNLDYLTRVAGRRDVVVDDVSEQYGILSLQGPLSIDVLAAAGADVSALPYFGVTSTTLAGKSVMISRTGFTGDLEYEVWAEAPDAFPVFDTIIGAGADFNLVPIGSRALTMARLEAGLLLIDVDFTSARHAWTAADRETPDELSLGWMVKDPHARPFVGAAAIARERELGASRWIATRRRAGFADRHRHHAQGRRSDRALGRTAGAAHRGRHRRRAQSSGPATCRTAGHALHDGAGFLPAATGATRWMYTSSACARP